MAESILTENDLANCTSGCGYENWYQSGKIYIKGPSVMKGYFGIKEATAEAIDSEEWLRSGDIGYYDDEDDFYIVDRAKELFKSGDRQVSSVELEVPAIADVAVIGIPDNSAGELPRAYVVKREGEKVTTDEITQYKSGSYRTRDWKGVSNLCPVYRELQRVKFSDESYENFGKQKIISNDNDGIMIYTSEAHSGVFVDIIRHLL